MSPPRSRLIGPSGRPDRVRKAVVGGLLAAAVVLGAVPAGAAPPEAAGWWTRRPGAAPRGDGDIELAADLQGEASVAAVRVPAGALRLVLTEDGAAPEGTAFRACPATTPWVPADGGAWDARPQADCDAGAVDAVRGASGQWTVELGTLDATDLVLVPVRRDVVPGLAVGFTAAFSTLDVVTSAPTGSGSSTPRPAPAPSTGTATPVAPPPTRVPSVAVPAPNSPLVPPAPAPAPVDAPPQETAAPGPGTSVPTPMFDFQRTADDRPWGRLLVLVPLSALAGLAAAGGRNIAWGRYLTLRRTRNDPTADSSSNLPLANAGE